jgi:hypothetical protein
MFAGKQTDSLALINALVRLNKWNPNKTIKDFKGYYPLWPPEAKSPDNSAKRIN